ncbi:MAG TPA: hypothetical protein VK617_01555, partial [Gemmatimonadaceae bacterium]|nr:hypothetical protein [Gemmatimonadaceae bacterium]
CRRELAASSDRLNTTGTNLYQSSVQLDSAQGELLSYEKKHPKLETAREKGIDVSDPAAPSPDYGRRLFGSGETQGKWGEGIEKVVAGVGIATHLMTAVPEANQELLGKQPLTEHVGSAVAGSTITLDEKLVVQSRPESEVSATPHQKEGKDPEKPDLDAPVGDIGDLNKITSSGDLKEKSKKLVEDAEKANTAHESTPTRSADDIAAKPQESAAYNTSAEFRTQPTWPDPERSAAAIASQPAPAPANDNVPQPKGPSVAAQSQPSPERPAGGGMPDPDPPARAIATQPPPANDNNPRSPANDNDPNL